MKKFVAGAIFGGALMLTTSVFADGALKQITAYLTPDVSVEVNGKKVALENVPVNYDGSTYLPVRELASAVGLAVDWDDASRTAKLSSGSAEVEPVKDDTPTANDKIDMANPTKVLSIDGERYILIVGIMRLNEAARFEYADKKLSLHLQKDGKIVKDLMDDIPHLIYEGNLLIEYQYYEDTIKPLVNQI